jgi:cytochrome c biogenesis protein CcmG/thiol:disulfide interchange protein DsbE
MPGQAATKMPSFKLEDVRTGKLVKSSTFKGQSLLVMFFATWCPPCIQEIPNLIKLQNQFSQRKFSVVGISVDQEKGVVESLIDNKSINYPVMMADKEVTRDFGGVYGIPTAFLVNSKGHVTKRYTGYIAHSVLVKDLEKILK